MLCSPRATTCVRQKSCQLLAALKLCNCLALECADWHLFGTSSDLRSCKPGLSQLHVLLFHCRLSAPQTTGDVCCWCTLLAFLLTCVAAKQNQFFDQSLSFFNAGVSTAVQAGGVCCRWRATLCCSSCKTPAEPWGTHTRRQARSSRYAADVASMLFCST